MLRGIAFAITLTAAGASQAAQLNLAEKLQLQQACQADFKAACGDQKPGDGRLAQCIRDNVTKLSEPCRAAIESVRADFLAESDTAMDF